MGGMNFHGGGLLGFDMRTSQLSSELDLVFARPHHGGSPEEFLK